MIEKTIWHGNPSQLENAIAFAICGVVSIACIITAINITTALLLPPAILFIYCLFRWRNIRCTKYIISNQRLRFVAGVFSRRTDEIELYRIKDTSLLEPMHLRIFSLATIWIASSDRSEPFAFIRAIPLSEAVRLREIIRIHVEYLRGTRRVYE